MASTASGEVLSARPVVGEKISPRAPKWIWLGGLILVLAGSAVYSNSFVGGFSVDDGPSILHNLTIQQGWWEALQPPGEALSVSGRPLMNFSLALNYELGGFNAWGYHALNLAIQLLAGLTLFGIARRTLEQPMLSKRYGASALPLAWIIALLWTIHPMQTESVTDLIQRAESLMGLLYLLTLYCFIRGVDSTWSWAWYILSATACLLGMLTKEVMASAPFMVLLYDRTFVAGTFAKAWRRRWQLYAALAGTWAPLAWIVVNVSWPGNASLKNPGLAGLSLGMKSFVFALKQCDAVVHYLALSFWPHPLVLEYGNDVVTNPLHVAPQILALTLLVGGSIYALWRQRALGFLGAWFFVILAPTSSIVPLNGQTMAEHHMYLSLAAVTALTVLGLYELLGRRVYIAGMLLALGWGGLAFERNRDYRTNLSSWTNIVLNRPDDAGNNIHLGGILQYSGRMREAAAQYKTALRINPADPDAEDNLGSALYSSGQAQEAITHFLLAAKLKPDDAQIYYNLGNAYHSVGQQEQARDAFVTAVRLEPNFALAHNNLGSLYMVNFHDNDKAINEFASAIRIDPTLYEAQASLANLYTNTSRPAEAIPHYKKAIHLKSDFGEAYLGLGNALFLTNQADDSLPQFQTAIRLMPNNAAAHGNYATVLFQLKRYAEAIPQFEQALHIDPNFPHALENLQAARQLVQLPPPSSSPSKP